MSVTYVAGSLLLSAGLVTRDQLLASEALRQREGGTLGECLVRLGVVTEEQLVDFYHRRLLVPRLDPARLDRPSPRALAALPADMAAEFRVFPVAMDGEGTITLAMADPANTHAVDELSFFTDRFLERAVAPESAIRAAIERWYGVHFDAPPSSAPIPAMALARRATPAPAPVLLERRKTPSPVPSPPAPVEKTAPIRRVTAQMPIMAARDPAGDGVMLLTRVKHTDEPAARPEESPPTRAPASERERVPTPAEILTAAPLDRPRTPTAPRLPGLTLQDERSPPPSDEPIPLTRLKSPTPERRRAVTLSGLGSDPPLAAIRAARSRDEVAGLVLDYLATMAPRAALFVVRHGQLLGHDGRGAELDVAVLRDMAVPGDGGTLLNDVVRSRLPYRGPLPNTPANRAFARSIDGRQGDVLLLPVLVRERAIAVLYADGIESTLPDAALHAVSREAGRAYERLILEAKR